MVNNTGFLIALGATFYASTATAKVTMLLLLRVKFYIYPVMNKTIRSKVSQKNELLNVTKSNIHYIYILGVPFTP